MSDWYNLSYLDNTTVPVGLIDGVNTASGNWLAGILLLGFAILFFVVFYDEEEIEKVFLADAWLTTILAALMWAAEWLEFWTVGVCVVPAVGALILVIWTKN